MKGISINSRVLNVTLIFFSAYLCAHLLYLFFVYFCASFIGVDSVTYYFSYIAYDLSNFQGWTRLKIAILFGIPTLLMPVIAGLSWLAMKMFSFGNKPKIKLFYLMLIIVALSFFIADFIISPFQRQGVALVAEWFYFKREAILGISFVFWTLIPLISFLNAKSFMKLANSRTHLRTKWSRAAFLITHILQPFIFSSLILSGMIIMVPAYTIEHFFSLDLIRLLVISLILLFIVIFNFNKKYIGIKKNRELDYIQAKVVFVALIITLVIYFTLYF